MNKNRGNVQFVSVLIIILIIILISNKLVYEHISTVLQFFITPNYLYIVNVTSPQTISSSQLFEISVVISNPKTINFRPYLEVDFDKNSFFSDNHYLIQNIRIPIGTLEPGEKTIYYLTFVPHQDARGKYSFEFILYNSTVSSNPLENRKVFINIE